jgi:hypothetical protein
LESEIPEASILLVWQVLAQRNMPSKLLPELFWVGVHACLEFIVGKEMSNIEYPAL